MEGKVIGEALFEKIDKAVYRAVQEVELKGVKAKVALTFIIQEDVDTGQPVIEYTLSAAVGEKGTIPAPVGQVKLDFARSG